MRRQWDSILIHVCVRTGRLISSKSSERKIQALQKTVNKTTARLSSWPYIFSCTLWELLLHFPSIWSEWNPSQLSEGCLCIQITINQASFTCAFLCWTHAALQVFIWSTQIYVISYCSTFSALLVFILILYLGWNVVPSLSHHGCCLITSRCIEV